MNIVLGTTYGICLFYLGYVYAGGILIGLGVVAAGFTWSDSVKAKALWVMGGVGVIAVVLAYHAATNEITGTAVYRTFSKHDRGELVTRAGSPAKFREATNLLWGTSLFCLMVDAAAWKIGEWLDDSFDF